MRRAGMRDQDGGVLAAIFASITVAAAVMALTGNVYDLATAGSLSSILGLHVGVIVYVVARRLSRRMREARVLSLRREDRRSKDHLAALINLCKSLVLGAMSSGPGSPAAMSAMRHAAYHMATARAMYGYLFTETGRRVAENVRVLASSSVSGQACAAADLSAMLRNLGRLEGEMLDIDGDELSRRRMQETGATDPVTE